MGEDLRERCEGAGVWTTFDDELVGLVLGAPVVAAGTLLLLLMTVFFIASGRWVP